MIYYNTLNLFSPKELIKLKTEAYGHELPEQLGHSNTFLMNNFSLLQIKRLFLKSIPVSIKLAFSKSIISNLIWDSPLPSIYHEKITKLTSYGIFYCLYIEFSLTLKLVYTKRASDAQENSIEDDSSFILLLEYLNILISFLSIIIHSLNFTSSNLRYNLTPIIMSNSPNSLLSLSLELLQLYSKDNNLYSYNKILILLSLCIDCSHLPSECIDMSKREYLSRVKYSDEFLKDSIELYDDRITLTVNNNKKGSEIKDDIFSIGKFKSLEEMKDITNNKYVKHRNSKIIQRYKIPQCILDLFDDKFLNVLEAVYSNIKYDTEYFYDKLYMKETNEELGNKEMKLFKSQLINTTNSIILKLLKENKTQFKSKLKEHKLASLFYNNIFRIANKQSLFYTKRGFEGLQDLNSFGVYNYKVDVGDLIDKDANICNIISGTGEFVKKWTDYNLNVNKLNGLRILQKIVKRESFEERNSLFYDYSMMDNVHSELELGFRFVDDIQYKYLMKVLKEEYRNKDYEAQLKEIGFLGHIFKATYTKIGEDWISDVNQTPEIYESEY